MHSLALQHLKRVGLKIVSCHQLPLLLQVLLCLLLLLLFLHLLRTKTRLKQLRLPLELR
jgi:hypothetical protein